MSKLAKTATAKLKPWTEESDLKQMDFKLQNALSMGIVKRKDGTYAKSFLFSAEKMKGWKVEFAEVNKAGMLQVIVIKEKN